MEISNDILEFLVKFANKAMEENEVPVSAVIVDCDGNIISYGYNNRQGSNNVLGHAEINAILSAESIIGDWRLDGYSMYVTLEPCSMCSAVILESRLDNVFYFLPKNDSVISSSLCINKALVDGYENYKMIFNDLLTHFFDNMR